MKNFLLLLAMLTSLIANAYEPMIREDRIWEYEYWSSDNLAHTSDSEIYQFKFDGTESRGNKTYNILKYKIKDSENEWIPVALMRENVNAKTVYLFVDCEASISMFGEDMCVNLSESEVPLYQWNDRRLPDAGGKITIPAFANESYEFESVDKYSRFNITERNIAYKEKRSFFGIEREIVAYTPDYFFDGILNDNDIYDSDLIMTHIVYVEGIGNVLGGLLHRPLTICMSTGGGHISMEFLRQTDLNGSITFLPLSKWKELDNVESVNAESRSEDGRKYDLQGIETDRPEPGSIYIENGEKHIAR